MLTSCESRSTARPVDSFSPGLTPNRCRSVSPDGNDGLGAILDIDRYGYTVKPEAQCSWRPSPELAVTLGYVMTTSSSNAS